MNRALITGGTGFIGLHVAKALAGRDARVDLLDLTPADPADTELTALLAGGTVTHIVGDLRDPATWERVGRDYDVIIHLAAMLGVSAVASAPYRVLSENLETTTAAIELARRQAQLRRFVFASTSEVYGGTQEQLDLPIPTPEQVVLALPDLDRPRTSYMLSKIYGEALTRHSGLPYTIIRPHNVYGPRMGMRHVIPEMLKRARELSEGQAFAVYSADHTRTFCYVDDAVEMILRAVEAQAGDGVAINIGAPAPEVTMAALGRMVLQIVGRSAPIDPQPATPGSPARRCPDMARCIEITGFCAETPLEDGVRQTYDWYLTNHFDRPGPAHT